VSDEIHRLPAAANGESEFDSINSQFFSY
jgi:hypothetical protein